MTWMQTHSGRALDLAAPDPADVRLEDVAFSLAHLNRYNGHAGRYSVAEHCCLVADYCEAHAPALAVMHSSWVPAPRLALAGLLHDASEAYVGDLTYPMQCALPREARTAVRELHARVWHAIRRALVVPPGVDIHAPAVKWVDRQVLLDERNALMGPPPRPWAVPGEPLGVRVEGWDPERARAEWLGRFERLMVEVARG